MCVCMPESRVRLQLYNIKAGLGLNLEEVQLFYHDTYGPDHLLSMINMIEL